MSNSRSIRAYLALLNSLVGSGSLDPHFVEAFWKNPVRDFFVSKPFQLRLEASKGLRAVVRDVLEQAAARQREMGGVYYPGAVM